MNLGKAASWKTGLQENYPLRKLASWTIGLPQTCGVQKLVGSCTCAMSWYDLDLIFDLAVVTFTLKMLSGLYLGKFKV